MAILVFALSAAFLLHVLFLYPLLLAWLSRRGIPVVKSFAPRTVSILLPVRNGEPWLRRKLESILALDYPRERLQVLVISDGSRDRTEEIAREFVSSGVELVSIEAGGKDRALNAGMERARGEILFFTDVRQELAPESLARLVACFADPSVGVVSGELHITEGNSREEASVGLYWRYEKWIRKHLSRLDSVIGATGCIYAMRRELALPLPPGILLDDVYLPLVAFFRGYRVIFEEQAKAFDYPSSLDTEFRRKVRTLAGNYQLIGHFPALLLPSNRLWLHFVSHKLGRLLLPFALLGIASSSFGLPSPWREASLAAQALLYGTALLDYFTPERAPWKRLSSPLRAFLVLMGAAFCAPFLLARRGPRWKETRIGAAGAAPR
jgi:poly-beta-1,6-N-acetyl-D-glucosamine synthase